MAANTDKATDSQPTPEAATVTSMPNDQAGQRPKQSAHPRRKKLIKSILGLALLVIILIFGWHVYNNSKNVVIGKTTITPGQVNELSDEIKQYTKKNKNISYGEPHDTARNYLILNAALKKEADKYHVTVTQSDIDKSQAAKYEAYRTKANYEAYVEYEGITQLTKVTAENDVYKAKLEDKIIAKKDLFVAAIVYDTPYVLNSKNPSSEALRGQAVKTMQNKFLPLFQQGKSNDQIIAQADISPEKPIRAGANSPYFNKLASVAFYAKGCTTAKPCFQDIKAKTLTGLPAVVSTQSEIDKLTKVGQTTGVFNSEAGFVGVMRLTAKTSGNYNSWDHFLQSYEKKYANGKLLAVSLLLGSKAASVMNFLEQHLKGINSTVDSFLWPKAAADAACTDNSEHFVQIHINAHNQSGADLSGVNVTETRPTAQCPNSSGRYVDSQPGPNHGPNGGSTNASGRLDLNDNCYNSPPDWSQSGPGNNHIYQVRVHDTLGGFSVLSVGDSFNGPVTEANIVGKAVTKSNIWSNGILNQAGLSIDLYYQHVPPSGWTLNGNTTVDGASGTINKQPGAHVTFRHTVHNNGPSTATYSWVVKDSNGGGYGGTGVNSGGDISTASDGNRPNDLQQGYNIPNNAHNGDLYCQRIDYTDANGAGTVAQNSTPACVRVQTNPTGAQSYGCSQTTIDIPHVNGYLNYVTIEGTDSDGSYEVAHVGSRNKIDLHYTALAQYVKVTTHVYHWQGSPPSWVEISTTPMTYHCYHASCSVTSVEGDGPGNIVQAGHPFKIKVAVTNDNPDPSRQTIQSSVGGHDFSVTEAPDEYQGGYVHNSTGFSLNPGQTETKEINFSGNGNSNQIRDITMTFFPDYANYDRLGGNCSTTFRIYQKFDASLGAQTILKPTTEHPYDGADYKTTITVKNGFSHNVNIPTNSAFYKKPAAGGTIGIASNSGGTYPSSPGGVTTTTLDGHHNIAEGSYQAGDEYCSTIHANYTTGYVGPDNNVVHGSAPGDATSCPRVANEPYFKVYNSDISAGGAFEQCTNDGGTLAGYADISDPPGVTRGASTQLSALALLKITGVASAQSPGVINSPPTKLSFANSGVQVDSAGNESPVLGGQYEGCRTLTNETAPASAADYGSSTFNVAGKNGAYKHTGNLVVNGSSLAASQNVSIFVDGDVYMASNTVYGNGWQAGTAPSLVVHATGNIYIDPGVTRLAGLYIARDKSDGSKGRIYTCGNRVGSNFVYVPTSQLYNTCKNQLVVTGSFVAKQTNLMRTFGSLRDEEPNPGTPGGGTLGMQWSSCGSYGHPVGGEACLSGSPSSLSLRCINTNEPSDPNGWGDNILCVPNSSSLNLYWTHCENYPGCDQSAASISHDPGLLHLNTVKNHGFPFCTKWSVPADSHTWDDNWLCSNQNVGLHFATAPTPGEQCTKISEIADHDGQWSSGYYLCAPITPATPPTPTGPPFTGCSNAGVQSDTKACAGEIFEYSPTLFLSSPAVDPPGDGSLQFQSITSLPPVL